MVINLTFRTRYNPGERFDSSPVGYQYETEYGYEIVDGYEELVPTGSIDLVAKIQESFESTKLCNIIARFNAGDLDALKKVQGVFVDISQMPKSLQEAQNMRIKAEDAFDQLPVEIREKYDFSAFKFYDEGGIEFLKNYIADAEYKAPSELPIEKDVTTNESK